MVAGGPSASDAPLGQVQGRCRVITINNSWRLAPWADVLYACDYSWWRAFSGVPEFNGIKISQDPACDRSPWGIHRVTIIKDNDRLLVKQPGVLGWGGNSGFHALNLAVQFGASKIILVGYDMRLDQGVHWHGRHQHGLNNPTALNVERWCRAVDGAADVISGLGIRAINASPVSRLTAYAKMSLMEALTC
ncbi:hypothetical protein FJ937_17245 [Mesorhizobium sp. B2-4-4]|nr:hypothetical protein FJ937_17245 [Mesorhizobium sp. B2-4-4]